MKISDLTASAGVLPISEKGLRNVVELLAVLRDNVLDTDDYLDDARYAIRAVAALLPYGYREPLEVAQVVQPVCLPTLPEWINTVEALGPYFGEAGAREIRQLLGLIDDGITPARAVRMIGLAAEESELLNDLLDLNGHWFHRTLDRVHVLVFDGAGVAHVRRVLRLSWLQAFRLVRRVRAGQGHAAS